MSDRTDNMAIYALTFVGIVALAGFMALLIIQRPSKATFYAKIPGTWYAAFVLMIVAPVTGTLGVLYLDHGR